MRIVIKKVVIMRVVIVPVLMEKANLLLKAALKVFLFQLETKFLPPSSTSLLSLPSQSSLSPSSLTLFLFSLLSLLPSFLPPNLSLSSALLSSSFSFISVSPPPLTHSLTHTLSLFLSLSSPAVCSFIRVGSAAECGCRKDSSLLHSSLSQETDRPHLSFLFPSDGHFRGNPHFPSELLHHSGLNHCIAHIYLIFSFGWSAFSLLQD